MRRLAFLAAFSLLAACGGGGGGGGYFADGPAFWGIPFAPVSASRDMIVGLKNLDDAGTTATVTGFEADGTPYGAPFVVTLDAFDEHRFSANVALGEAGGWIEVDTPSRRVEVYFNVVDAGKAAEESARAAPLPDLLVPPPLTKTGIAVNGLTDFIQISNASPVPNLIDVTAFEEPAADPLLPPTVTTPAPIVLLAFETILVTPDALSGIAGFIGSFDFTSPSPFFVASVEDLAYDVPRDRKSVV